MQGGGACFNSQSCLGPPRRHHQADGLEWTGDDGLMDRANAQNPVKDWNFVFIPYCTGDVHAGFNEASKADGAGKNNRVGATLTSARDEAPHHLSRLIALHGDERRRLWRGGDFQVQRMFGDTPVDMLDDSVRP